MTTYAPQTTDPKAPEWARSKSRLAGSIASLKDGLNAHYPNRDHTSDGFIGDDRHLSEGTGSDHNPWWQLKLPGLAGEWLVRAGDFDVDGINAPWLAEQLRLAGAAGDPRLRDGGYVIFNGHITLPDFSGWTPYTGDPHTTHVHVSAARNGACDVSNPWAFLAAAAPAEQPTDPGPVRPPAPAPAAAALAEWTGPDATGVGAGFKADAGNNGARVQLMQAELNRVFPAYSKLTPDGWYGPKTAGVLAEFQHRAAHDPHCPADDVAGLAQSDGSNVGGRTARAFVRYGFNL